MSTVNLPINSISGLQSDCNTLEMEGFEKLISLEAVRDIDGEKVTQATFDGDADDLGNRTITEGGDHSAWITGRDNPVSISIS